MSAKPRTIEGTRLSVSLVVLLQDSGYTSLGCHCHFESCAPCGIAGPAPLHQTGLGQVPLRVCLLYQHGVAISLNGPAVGRSRGWLKNVESVFFVSVTVILLTHEQPSPKPRSLQQALASAARDHQDLNTQQGLSLFVAQSVGGPDCVI